MVNLFDKWKTKIPNYSKEFKNLFDVFSKKGGAEGEKKVRYGKHFSTNYELYMYAFFLGLYKNEYSSIEDKGSKEKENFSHHIQHWGSKTTTSLRKDFTNLQEYIFSSLIAKSEIDFLALEKGEITEDFAVNQLINTMEGYTNGGLTLINEKLEEDSNFFLIPTSFLDLILDSK